jgi:hypothetical protein
VSWFQQSANGTEADKDAVCLFVAVAFAFQSATVRVWSGFGDLTFGGFTYTGTGDLGKITAHTEQVVLVSEKKTYQLSGVDPALVPEADFDSSFGRSVTEYFGFLTQAGAQVATPEINWEGRIDSCRRVDGSTPLIEVNAEYRLSLVDQTDGWRYTHEHQQQFFAGDDGLKYVPTLETTEILWGGSRVYPGSGGGRGPRVSGNKQ